MPKQNSVKNNNNNDKNNNSLFFDVILPHLALILFPLLAAINTTLAAAAFRFYDPAVEEPVHPLTLITVRTIISAGTFILIKKMGWFGSNVSPDVNDDTLFEEKIERKQVVIMNNKEKEQQEKEKENDKENNNHKTSSTIQISTTTTIVKRDILKSQTSFVDWGKVVVCGVIGIVFNFLTFFYAVEMTTQIIIAAEMCLLPFIVYVLGYFTANETYSQVKVLVTILLLVGNVFMAELWKILFPSDDGNTTNENNSTTTAMMMHNTNMNNHPVPLEGAQNATTTSKLVGAFLMFLSVCCFACYLVFQKPLVKKFNLVDFMTVVMITGAIGLIVTTWIPREHIVMNQLLSGRMSRLSWIAILYAGTIQSSGTFFLIAYTTEKLQSPLFSSIMSNSTPVFVVLISMHFLGETMDQFQLFGAFVVMIGVSISVYISVQGKMDDHSNNKKNKEKIKQQQQKTTKAEKEQQSEVEEEAVPSEIVNDERDTEEMKKPSETAAES